MNRSWILVFLSTLVVGCDQLAPSNTAPPQAAPPPAALPQVEPEEEKTHLVCDGKYSMHGVLGGMPESDQFVVTITKVGQAITKVEAIDKVFTPIEGGTANLDGAGILAPQLVVEPDQIILKWQNRKDEEMIQWIIKNSGEFSKGPGTMLASSGHCKATESIF